MRLKPKTKKKAPESEKTPASDPIQIDDSTVSSNDEIPDEVVTPEPVAEDPEELARENNVLWGHCSEIAYLLEMNWHKIGWELERLRTPTADRAQDAVYTAFEPLRGEYRHDLIHSLLRPTSLSATRAELQRTSESQECARQKLIGAQSSHDSQLERCQESDRAVFEADPKRRKELREEITRRIANRLMFERECKDTKTRIAAARAKLRKATLPLRQATEMEISKLEMEYNKSQQGLEVEEKILRDFKKRHDAATKQNWIWAKEVTEKRRAELNRLEKHLQECRRETERLEALYQDQGAGFARKDLLRFLVEKRALHHPGQLARAIAGLPGLSCRESFARCGKSPFPREPHQNWELFEVIARAWEKRDRTAGDPQLHIQLFEHEISDLPETREWNGEDVPNFIRDKFESNRQELGEAICECLRSKPLPGAVPYIITEMFLGNISRQEQRLQQQTPLERVLSERSKGN